MRKFVICMLVICLIGMSVMPALATDTTMDAYAGISIERYESGWFYYEETSTYRISMQLTDGGYIDYAYFLFDAGLIMHNSDQLTVGANALTRTSAASLFGEKREELINQCDTSQVSAEYYVQDDATNSLRSIPSNHAAIILNKLNSLGHPAEQLRLLATVNTGGYAVEIWQLLVHQYVLDRNYFLEALTAISVISTLVGLPSSTLLLLLSFSLEVGSYVLENSATLSKYDVTLVYTKTAEVDGRALLAAGRQIRWKAYIGTDDSILEQYSDNPHQYYYYSLVDFAEKALENM